MNAPAAAMHDDLDGPLRFRSIWISDLHLGTPGCQAALLLDFLRQTESEFLYLVGDIVDGWQLRRRWYWPQAHNDVAQKVLRKVRKGTQVYYLPGNHDAYGARRAVLVALATAQSKQPKDVGSAAVPVSLVLLAFSWLEIAGPLARAWIAGR